MPTSKYNWILIFFALATITNLFAEIIESQQLVYISKPLLMLTLAAYFWLSTPKSKFRNWIFIAIIFAMIGDIFLMLNGRHGADNNPMFLYGLGSFFCTHFCYAFAFARYRREQDGIMQEQPLWQILFFLVLFLFLKKMHPYIPSELSIAVEFYSTLIIIMAIAAVDFSSKISRATAKLILLGVFLFIFSDTCIAINKFTDIQLPKPGLIIMLTYILGQLAIVIGATKVAQES